MTIVHGSRFIIAIPAKWSVRRNEKKLMLEFSWNAYGWDDIAGNNVFVKRTQQHRMESACGFQNVNKSKPERVARFLIIFVVRPYARHDLVFFFICVRWEEYQANETGINHTNVRMWEWGIKQISKRKMKNMYAKSVETCVKFIRINKSLISAKIAQFKVTNQKSKGV